MDAKAPKNAPTVMPISIDKLREFAICRADTTNYAIYRKRYVNPIRTQTLRKHQLIAFFVRTQLFVRAGSNAVPSKRKKRREGRFWLTKIFSMIPSKCSWSVVHPLRRILTTGICHRGFYFVVSDLVCA